MGEGEFAGDGTRGLPPGMGTGAELPVCGVLWATLGESKPNWIPDLAPPTGPPFGALAAMVTELFREWFEAEPLATELLRAMAGTAGVKADLPFTGAGEAGLAFCEGEAEEEPTTAGG